jgi:hypothetical protein
MLSLAEITISFVFAALALLLQGGGCGRSTADEDYHPGIGRAHLTFSSSIPSSEGEIPVYDNVVITINNDGTEPATGLSAQTLEPPFYYLNSSLRGWGGGYPGWGGTCGSSLGPGQSCRLVLAYIPSTFHPAGDEDFVLNYHQGEFTKTLRIRLNGGDLAPEY